MAGAIPLRATLYAAASWLDTFPTVDTRTGRAIHPPGGHLRYYSARRRSVLVVWPAITEEAGGTKPTKHFLLVLQHPEMGGLLL